MKENKKRIIICIIISLLSIITGYILFTPTYYILKVDTGSKYNNATGILTKNLWKGTFFLNVNFDNPNEYCTVGLFIYNQKKNTLELLESSSKISDSSECGALQTPSGHLITNKTFLRREKSYHNGNIINKMISNKENTYLCISKNSLEGLTINDCYKINFNKYN